MEPNRLNARWLIVTLAALVCIAALCIGTSSHYPYARSLDDKLVERAFVYAVLGERRAVLVNVPRSAIIAEFGDIDDPKQTGHLWLSFEANNMEPFFPLFYSSVKRIRAQHDNVSSSKARALATEQIDQITVILSNRHLTRTQHGRRYFERIEQNENCVSKPSDFDNLIEVLSSDGCFDGPRGSTRLFFKFADGFLFPKIRCAAAKCTIQSSFKGIELKLSFRKDNLQNWQQYLTKVMTYLEAASTG